MNRFLEDGVGVSITQNTITQNKLVVTDATQTLTNKTLTTPKLGSGGSIVDVNGNEIIKVSATVASAVNEVTVTNSITGQPPKIEASGGDTDINLSLGGKGTGGVLIQGRNLVTDIGVLSTSTTTDKSSVIAVTNEINNKIDISNAIKFYGKYSLATGGSSISNANGFVAYSAEQKDDFNAINIGVNPTRITIPSGVSVARFYFNGQVNSSNITSGTSAQIDVALYKNGTINTRLAHSKTISSASTSASGGSVSFGWTEPMDCTVGDYFEIYVSCSGSTASLSADSKFGMEVLG